jgi:hypothetical protein
MKDFFQKNQIAEADKQKQSTLMRVTQGTNGGRVGRCFAGVQVPPKREDAGKKRDQKINLKKNK